jgi:phytanoyl-CoA hydroxylase
MNQISAQQLAQYQEVGYLALENFVDAAACRALRARAQELVTAFDPAGLFSIFTTDDRKRVIDKYFLESGDKIRFFFEESAFQTDGTLARNKEAAINKIGHALHDLDSQFSSFSRTRKLAELAADLGYADPRLLQSMYIFKQPYIGGEVGCHQDGSFLYTEPPGVTGFWFALEDATRENGCLWAIAGGHMMPLKSRFMRVGNDSARMEIYDDRPWPLDNLTPLEVAQGTLIILHGQLPHMSQINRSPKSRQAYILHIIDSHCRYSADNWLQRGAHMPLRGFEIDNLLSL